MTLEEIESHPDYEPAYDAINNELIGYVNMKTGDFLDITGKPTKVKIDLTVDETE